MSCALDLTAALVEDVRVNDPMSASTGEDPPRAGCMTGSLWWIQW